MQCLPDRLGEAGHTALVSGIWQLLTFGPIIARERCLSEEVGDMYVATALTDAVAFTSRPPSDHSERFALGPYGVINLRRLSSDRGDQAVDVTICAVCQTITLVDDGTLHAPYAGVWVHSGGCSTRWSAASEPERINWAVRAIRWREES